MKADVPIPYIISIILGIAIIALLGYWFFIASGGFHGQMTEQECRNLKLTFCTLWSTNGYVKENEIPKGPNSLWDNYSNGFGSACRSNYNIKVDASSDCL